MNLPAEDFATRRAELAAEIARQRGQLVAAYRDLEKPIRYAEYGMKGIGFLRSNPWIFVAVPGAVSIVTSILNLWRGEAAPAPSLPKVPKGLQQQQGNVPNKPKTLKDHAVLWGGYGWQAYQLYRRVRPLFL
jgi:hypothetical protein